MMENNREEYPRQKINLPSSLNIFILFKKLNYERSNYAL